jgi:hypothetical protein
MSTLTIPRPQADEHVEYYSRYISKVPDGDLIAMLRDQIVDTVGLLRGLNDEQANYAYAPGKWTIKEVIGHIADAERVFQYRALTFARAPGSSLPGFDENAWVPTGAFGRRTLADLLEEFQVVRASTVQLARSFDEEMLKQRGSANGNDVSVRALLYIIAGHERHHAALFRERYLKQGSS